MTGENFSGFYELFGVLTHLGRSSDSGHYISWIRHEKGMFLSINTSFLKTKNKKQKTNNKKNKHKHKHKHKINEINKRN